VILDAGVLTPPERTTEARSAAMRDIHAGPADLVNHFPHRNHDLTVAAIK